MSKNFELKKTKKKYARLTMESLLNSLFVKAKKENDPQFANNLKSLIFEYDVSQKRQKKINRINFDQDEEEDNIGISIGTLISKFDLSAKQAKFVRTYLITDNATKSAQHAGFSPTNSYFSAGVAAHVQLKNNKIKSALDWCYRKLEERTKVTPEWIVEKLKEIVERCMQAKPVLNKLGMPTGEYVFDSGGSNRALELLAKHLGMFVERVKLEGNPITIIQANEMQLMTPELATQKYLELIKSVDVSVLTNNTIKESLQLGGSNKEKENKFKRRTI